jgi:hypothetical protein
MMTCVYPLASQSRGDGAAIFCMTTPDPELQNLPNDFSNETLSGFPVYPLIHTIRKDVEINIGLFISLLWIVRMTNRCKY